MKNNPNQPRAYDAVIGGQNPAPVGAVVLGGIVGVKRRLASAVVEERVSALAAALKYGSAGLDLVIQALDDESWELERAAYSLLVLQADPKAEQALQKYRKGLGPELLRRYYAAGERNFIRANLSAANLRWATLQGANLSEADLYRANLYWANLSEANLSEADLYRASLSAANLVRATLRKANLKEAHLSKAKLSKANLCEANLSRANLYRANLCEANLYRANLCETNLCGASLKGASLKGASLTEVDLSGTVLTEVDLSGADLRKVDLSVVDLFGAYYSRATKFPMGFSCDGAGLVYVDENEDELGDRG